MLMALFPLLLVALIGCASDSASRSGKQDSALVAGKTRAAEGDAELYVFNISGWTLLPGKQNVTDNGEVFVSLPRLTYEKVRISAGPHTFGFSYRKRPSLDLTVTQGESYYIVVGYRPERSWAFPLGGDPVVIKQITEQEAQPLLNEFEQQ